MYDIAMKEMKEENLSLEDLFKKKKHLVTWFASNCGWTGGAKYRLNLVQKLVDLGLNVDRRLVKTIMCKLLQKKNVFLVAIF